MGFLYKIWYIRKGDTMKRICLLLLPLLLIGCSNNNDSNTGSSSDTTIEGNWSGNALLEMENALGESIPYLQSFGNNYYLETGFMASSSIPYVNIYWMGDLSIDWRNSYQNLLITSNYSFIDEDVDEEDSSCVWKNYAKTTSIGDLYVRYSFYSTVINNNNTYVFDIYSWLENGGGGGLVMPDVVDYTFLPTTFGASGVNYESSNRVFNVKGGTIYAQNIMNQNNYIQMKKAEARLYNEEPVRAIKYLNLKGLSVYGQSSNIVVKAGNDINNMKVISTYNDIYNLNGSIYFEIATNNRQVVRLDAIEILFM